MGPRVTAWVAHLFFWLTGARDEGGTAYGLMSGAGGALPDVLMPTAFAGWWAHNNCHQHRCWRIGRHPVGAAGVRTCRRHHPELGRHNRLTAEIIAEMHRRKP
jgi:hypothetical protein